MVYKTWNFQLSTDALKMKEPTNEIELVQVPVTDKCIPHLSVTNPHAFVVVVFFISFCRSAYIKQVNTYTE